MSGQFCGSCGQSAGATPAPVVTPVGAPAAAPMADNVAGMLCYLFGFVTGIIFLALAPYNQNKFVRFHAFQSIFLCVAYFCVVVAERVLTSILINISYGLFSIIALFWTLVWLAFLALAILLMVRAYQGQRWKLPVIGDLAEKQA